MKIYLWILPFTFIACGQTKEEQNKQVAMQMFAAFNEHDWAKMASFYTPDADYLDPAYGVEVVKKSPIDIIGKYSAMQSMFPDIHDEVKSMYAVDDRVIIEFVSSGSSGDSLTFKLPICTVLTFQMEKIIQDATYYDNQ